MDIVQVLHLLLRWWSNMKRLMDQAASWMSVLRQTLFIMHDPLDLFENYDARVTRYCNCSV